MGGGDNAGGWRVNAFRAEQQALAAHGLNYVIDTYLPQKLKRKTGFLP